MQDEVGGHECYGRRMQDQLHPVLLSQASHLWVADVHHLADVFGSVNIHA